MMYPQTSPCQHHDCEHGVCFQPPGSKDYVCKCAPGYSGIAFCTITLIRSRVPEYVMTISFLVIIYLNIIIVAGKRCEYLTSLSFIHNTSFVQLEPLRTKPEANVTIVFATTQENGVLLYDGHQEHLAVELFNGRIRVSYDVGNYPVSTMYR